MATYDIISRVVSEARYGAARAVGVPVSFSHRGAAAHTIYCQPGPAGIEPNMRNGVVTEVRTQEFIVPCQRHFRRSTTDTEPVTPGDTLTWQGKVYSVSQNVRMDPFKAVYHLETSEFKRLAEGVGK
jgi:hypothetical protein